MKERLLFGEVTREQYDEWRYMYPERSERFLAGGNIKEHKLLTGYDVLMGRSLDQKHSKRKVLGRDETALHNREILP